MLFDNLNLILNNLKSAVKSKSANSKIAKLTPGATLDSTPKSTLATIQPSSSTSERRSSLMGLLSLSSKDLSYYIYNSKSLVSYYWNDLSNKTFSFGFYYLRGLFVILFVDACLTDDEPLWEPIEWSLVQTWILFIFTFAWIAENLIVSRYGSYTGRDKRVWMGWYKTFWMIEGFYVLNYGAASVFVIIPFYYETNYNLSFVYSWWNWYSRTFFSSS